MLGYLSADVICSERPGTDNVQGQTSEHIFAPSGDYCVHYPSNIFRNTRSFENWEYIANSLHLARKYARIFVRGHYLFREAKTEESSRKTVNFEKQIMSKDKYPSTFSSQMGAIALIVLPIVFATRAFKNWGISLGYSPVLGEYSVT